MRKSIKVFIAIFIVLFGVFQLSSIAFAKVDIPSATSDFYVNDFANVFSTDEKARLMDKAVTLSDENNGIQVVVTTIESLEGNTIESYAVEMYNQYGIGKDDMGLLILLSTGDRQIRVEVGRAMEAYINDSKAGRFIDEYAIPSLKEDKFNEGLINLQEALIDEIVTEVSTESAEIKVENNVDIFPLLSILILIFIAIVIIVLVYKIITKIIEKQKTIDELREQLEISEQNAIEIKKKAIGEIENLQKCKNLLTSNYEELENKYKKLEDRYNRVQILYPSADKEVTNMIKEEIRQRNIKIAGKVDAIIQEVIDLPASKDIMPKLEEAKSCYLQLTTEQRAYVKSDIDKFEQLYSESLKLKQEYDEMMKIKRKKKMASEAVAAVTAIISCISIGRAKDYRKLKKAKSIYDNLDSETCSYFDKSTAKKLNRLYKEAKRDKEEEEEEERRRRYMQSSMHFDSGSSSHSDSGSSSHYGGFGGHSGGGGTSRGF